jgi:hypothetical protein
MGADPTIDRAINSRGPIKDFIQQSLSERVGFDDGLAELSRVANDAMVTQTLEPTRQGMTPAAGQLPQIG